MAKWGEIKCPRCAELEAKLEAIEALAISSADLERCPSELWVPTEDTLSDQEKERTQSGRPFFGAW
jgi:hypothetical protein